MVIELLRSIEHKVIGGNNGCYEYSSAQFTFFQPVNSSDVLNSARMVYFQETTLT